MKRLNAIKYSLFYEGGLRSIINDYLIVTFIMEYPFLVMFEIYST